LSTLKQKSGKTPAELKARFQKMQFLSVVSRLEKKYKDKKELSKYYKNRWLREHPQVVECHKIYNKALKNGILIRKPCQICGKNKSIHGHHPDHSKPLEVIWLCKSHHHRYNNVKLSTLKKLLTT